MAHSTCYMPHWMPLQAKRVGRTVKAASWGCIPTNSMTLAFPQAPPHATPLVLMLMPAAGQGTVAPEDVAEAVLLPFRCSSNCVPEEVRSSRRHGSSKQPLMSSSGQS